MTGLSSNDYERILDLAVAIVTDESAHLGLPDLTIEVNESLHGEYCLLAHSQIATHTGKVQAWAPAWLGHIGQSFLDAQLRENLSSCPLVRYYADSGDRTPFAVTDVTEREKWQRTHAYEVISYRFGAIHELCLPLRAQIGAIRTFALFRPPGDDFTERDLLYARRLQPLLVSADGHLRNLRKWREALAGPESMATHIKDVVAEYKLTPRELTVLHLLGVGLTAAAIARKLGVRPATAVKHKENLYRKLGTSDRLETVLRAQRLGLLSGQLSHGE